MKGVSEKVLGKSVTRVVRLHLPARMPRTKSAPSRKRALEAEAGALEEAVDVADLVETAEIDGFTTRIQSGACQLHTASKDEPEGLVRTELSDAIFTPLKELHELIQRRLASSLTGWGGVGDNSGRRRGYGYLANSSLAAEHFERSHVMKEYTGAEAEADRDANRRASVLLTDDELPQNLHEALRLLTAQLRPLLPERYRHVVTPENLVAAQPNLHNGKRYLRPHLDEPLHDGFGVVIVTVAIVGSARILLRVRPWDPSARSEWWFPLHAREAYALSGESRNVCLHGVLAEAGSEGGRRESLNLRFGLHTAWRGEHEADKPHAATRELGSSAEAADGGFSAWAEVERHWEVERSSIENATETAGTA